MPHARINTLAFHTRLHKNCQHAKHILDRDLARLRMIRAGRYANGPLAAKEYYQKARSGTAGVKSSFAAGADSGDGTDTVAVQDAGMCSIVPLDFHYLVQVVLVQIG
jgi:hypothetical protein